MLTPKNGNSGWFLGFGAFIAGAVLAVDRAGWAILAGSALASFAGYLVVKKDIDNATEPLRYKLKALREEKFQTVDVICKEETVEQFNPESENRENR